MARPLRWLKDELGELLATLRSRVAVLGSMVALLVLYLVGLLVPQAVRLDAEAYRGWRASRPALVRFLEWGGLIDVYASPLMYVALGAFFASLLAVLWERIPRLLRRIPLDRGLPLDPGSLRARRGVESVAVADGPGAIARAAARLEAQGYRLWMPDETRLRAVKHRFAPIGFILFHGSFALLLAGGIALDLTRYMATVTVAEGESFDLATARLTARPRLPRIERPLPRLAFTVLGVRAERREGTAVSLEADVLIAGESQLRTVAVNEPIRLGSTSVLLGGVSPVPLLTCATAAGASDGAYLKLSASSDETRAALPGCDLELVVRAVVPTERPGAGTVTVRDFADRAGGEALLEELDVTIFTPDGAVSKGTLRTGGSLRTGDGTRHLAMPEVGLQAHLQIVDERGGGALAAGFVASVLGLLARLVFYRREVAVSLDPLDGRVLIAVTADTAGTGGQARVLQGLIAALRREPAEGGASAASPTTRASDGSDAQGGV